jgi:hypothetical protein
MVNISIAKGATADKAGRFMQQGIDPLQGLHRSSCALLRLNEADCVRVF